MCAVSMMYDYMQRNVPPISPYWTQPNLSDFKEIIRRLDNLDRKLDQKDCVDPDKAKYLADVAAAIKSRALSILS